MKRAKTMSKSEKIEDLLRRLGRGDISVDDYRRMAAEQNISEEDVDQWCKEYHRAG